MSRDMTPKELHMAQKALGITDNIVNHLYKINEDGFLYFPERKIAISLNEKYESSNLYKPKDYFTNLSNKYKDNGIRLMNLFDWRIDHEDSWKKVQMLLITAIGNPKKLCLESVK